MSVKKLKKVSQKKKTKAVKKISSKIRIKKALLNGEELPKLKNTNDEIAKIMLDLILNDEIGVGVIPDVFLPIVAKMVSDVGATHSDDMALTELDLEGMRLRRDRMTHQELRLGQTSLRYLTLERQQELIEAEMETVRAAMDEIVKKLGDTKKLMESTALIFSSKYALPSHETVQYDDGSFLSRSTDTEEEEFGEEIEEEEEE